MPRKSLFLALALLVAACQPVPPSPTGPAAVMQPPRTPIEPYRGSDAPPSAPVSQRDANAEPARTIKIGLLLPLSGEGAGLGKSMLDAATLALFDVYDAASIAQGAIKVQLLPQDTGQGAGTAAKKAVEDGAELILGPLFSREVNDVASVARRAGINVISLSNDRNVAGRGVYLFGFSPEEQVERVARFVFRNNVKRIAVLAPADPYGSLVTKSLAREAEKAGADVTDTFFYPAGPENMKDAALRLMKSQRADSEQSFETLMLAEGGANLQALATALQAANVDVSRVRLLGTGKWDDSAAFSHPLLKGGWFASSPPVQMQNFARRFQKTYRYDAPRIASLAYDAVALAAALGLEGGDYSAGSLTRESGFIGPANGLFRLRSDGIIERGLAILEVGNGSFKVVNPAPSEF